MPLWCNICRFNRQKKITNWQLEHQRYIDEWMLMEQNNMASTPSIVTRHSMITLFGLVNEQGFN